MSIGRITDIKHCSRCKQHKVKAECFTRNINARDGYGEWCRDCMRVYRKARKIALLTAVEVTA